jgi:transcriptional regulator with XRE-family HTH domain
MLRKFVGLSQHELAARAGVTQAAVSRAETGSRRGRRVLARLAAALAAAVQVAVGDKHRRRRR